MRFFQKQQVDQIGVVSVALQKVLIILMILSLFSFGGLPGFLLCLIGFIGAYRRRTALLMWYFVASVIMMTASALFGAWMTFAYTGPYNHDMDDQPEFSSSSSSSESETAFAQARMIGSHKHGHHHQSSSASASASASMSESLSASASQSLSASASASASAFFSSSSSSMSMDWELSRMNFAMLFLVLVACFLVLYMKLFSLSLAWKLRKMINANATVLPTVYEEQEKDNSCAVPETENAQEMAPVPASAPMMHQPPFFQPGFVPYSPMPMPNMQFPGQPMPPMMYGQYPVYYSFAPIPQAPANPDEKL